MASATLRDMTTADSQRRWYLYKLRTLLVFVVLASVGLSWLGVVTKEEMTSQWRLLAFRFPQAVQWKPFVRVLAAPALLALEASSFPVVPIPLGPIWKGAFRSETPYFVACFGALLQSDGRALMPPRRASGRALPR